MGPGPVIGTTVRFLCLRCGSTAERPPAHLKAVYGAKSLADVARRARCLRYFGGQRCGGRARVHFEAVCGPSRVSPG